MAPTIVAVLVLAIMVSAIVAAMARVDHAMPLCTLNSIVMTALVHASPMPPHIRPVMMPNHVDAMGMSSMEDAVMVTALGCAIIMSPQVNAM
jgi:hypothetical protein